MHIFRKTLALTSATLLASLGLVALGGSANAADNIIPDPALAKCIREELNLPANKAITAEDLENLIGISCHSNKGYQVNSLQGLEKAVNLVILDLFGNEFSDVSTFSKLPALSTLNIDYTGTNLNFLKNLSELNYLFIQGKNLKDISAVRNLSNLEHLHLINTAVSDISVVRGLPQLNSFSIAFSPVKDLSPVSSLSNLSELTIMGTAVSDISALRNLNSLENLNLTLNNITDFRPLGGHAQVSKYDLFPQVRFFPAPFPTNYQTPLRVNAPTELPIYLANGTKMTAKAEFPRDEQGNPLPNITQQGNAFTYYFVSQEHYNFTKKNFVNFADYVNGKQQLVHGIVDPYGRNYFNLAFRLDENGEAFPIFDGFYRFIDISDYPFTKEIEWLADSGVTTGYPDRSFRPHDSVSRAAMAAFLYRLEGKPAYEAPKQSPFRDIRPGDDFYREICWLASKGITTGYADGTFKPWDPIARDAMAAFLHRYDQKVAAKKLPIKLAAKKFTDTAATPFAKDIAWLSQTGVTTGYGDGSFRPFEYIERGAIAAFFYRMKH